MLKPSEEASVSAVPHTTGLGSQLCHSRVTSGDSLGLPAPRPASAARCPGLHAVVGCLAQEHVSVSQRRLLSLLASLLGYPEHPGSVPGEPPTAARGLPGPQLPGLGRLCFCCVPYSPPA